MKLSIAFAALVFSTVSFATVPNDIVLTNVPTASKSYSQVTFNDSDIAPFKATLEAACVADKKAAEAFVLKTGSKILSSTGCKMDVTDRRYYDQGGPGEGVVITTEFKVLFK